MSGSATHGASPRVVAFVGRSGSGKTTLLERVIAELVSRGYRVGTVKHHGHDIELDVPRKDSWRHAQAGAVATVVSNPSQFALVQRVERERTLGELVALMPDVDIVLAEGFRAEAGACVEVLRAANASEPVCDAGELSAVVSDVSADALPAPLREAVTARGVPLLALDDVGAIADLALALAGVPEAVKRA